jgi:hypothetical protein
VFLLYFLIRCVWEEEEVVVEVALSLPKEMELVHVGSCL